MGQQQRDLNEAITCQITAQMKVQFSSNTATLDLFDSFREGQVRRVLYRAILKQGGD